MLVPERNHTDTRYRYGFNGKEKDDEVKGNGVQYDYGFRIYDARIGRFLSVDPLFAGYPYYTPYQFAGNRPIWASDLDGLEELCKTRKNVTIVRSWGKTIQGKVWYGGGGKGKYVETGEVIVEQGDEGGLIEVTETIYTQTALGGFNSTQRTYIEPSILEPSIPAVDPNDNCKEINSPPSDNPETPILQVKTEKEVKTDTQQIVNKKTDKKVVPLPKKTPPPYKKGDVFKADLEGLMFPRVESTGMNFIEGGQFPAKDFFKKLISDLKKSEGITIITISGFMTHGPGEPSNKVQAAFYNGLMKLPAILKDMGLPSNINVRVDYNNVKARQVNDKDSGEFKVDFKFN